MKTKLLSLSLFFFLSYSSFSQANNGNLAGVFARQNKFQESFENYTKTLKINEEIGNKKGIANNNYGIGEYYLKQNKLDEALIFSNNAKKLATEIGFKDVQQNVFQNLSEIYEKQGKWTVLMSISRNILT